MALATTSRDVFLPVLRMTCRLRRLHSAAKPQKWVPSSEGCSFCFFRRTFSFAALSVDANCSGLWRFLPYSTRAFHCSMRLAKKDKRKREPVQIRAKSSKPLVKVWVGMSARELAHVLGVSLDDVEERILTSKYADMFQDVNQPFELIDVINDVVIHFGSKPDIIKKPKTAFAQAAEDEERDKDAYPQPPPDPSCLVRRPAVVTIMGHVDHGKTTLLDALRKSQIVLQEFGGITQHIGAFVVKLPKTGDVITFLDTPGHAAFKSMRSRGAHVTDLVVLVVAADDGVMEQTIESIKYARQADVPMMVAINKIDKFDADIERTKRSLLAEKIFLEGLGGDVQAIPISALKGTNVDGLQEAIVALAEILDLKGDPTGLVEGAVIESRTAHGIGKLCTVLVQRGTLRKGCFLVAGKAWCKVRALFDEHGGQVEEAPPSFPVEVAGWRDELPNAGDVILEVESENRAKEVIDYRNAKARQKRDADDQRLVDQRRADHDRTYHEQLAERHRLGFRTKMRRKITHKPKEVVTEHEGPQLNVIIKGLCNFLLIRDVDGSVDAILDVLSTYDSRQCRLDLVEFGVGSLTESEVLLAAEFNAVVYCFNIETPRNVRLQAEESKVDIKDFNIIYRLVDDLKLQLNQRLPMVDKEEILGEGFVLKHFLISNKYPVAGCRCTKGMLSRKHRIRIKRGVQVIFDGEVESMRREKEIVQSATKDQEVGIMVADKGLKFHPDDTVLCYQIVKVPQTTDWNPPGF